MMLKRAFSSVDGEPPVHLIEPGRMTKVAGMMPMVEEFIERLRPDPRYMFTLVNAMGYSEFFGPNSNRDYYGFNPHLDFNGLLHAPETCPSHGDYVGWQTDPVVQQRVAKNWPFGYPSFYGATVYAHHKNSDPSSLGFGDVVFAAPNEAMKRIELVMRVDSALAAQRGHSAILDRVQRGDRVDVSMGCFKAGAMISLADGTKKPIEQIAVGDRVRTHTGGAGRVTELYRRKYRGEFFEIKPANEDVFHATVEHPFWAAFEAKDTRRMWKMERPDFGWEYARDLDGAVLSRPKVTKTIRSESITKEWARIIGYYLAEGHIVFDKKGNYAGIELTVNGTDAVNEEIAGLCAAVRTRNAPVWRQRENSDSAWAIGIYDPFVAEVCVAAAGRYSKTKRLEEAVLYWPEELQWHLLGAYINGDGFSADGDLLISTSSDALVHQVREILFRLGVPTSYQQLRHKAGSGMSREDTFEWVISIGKQWAGSFAPYCAKAAVTEIHKKKNILKDYGDLWAVPIREYSSYYGEADVYNFEVEGDNSYIVNGVAAHNCKVPFDLCSVCTDWDTVKTAWKGYDPKRHAGPGIAILAYHRTVKPIRGLAVTKADYCAHMVERPGAILDDGQKVFVYNDFPRFFDISFVWIGADRTARVMWFLVPAGGSASRRPASIGELMKEASMTKTASATVPKVSEVKQSEMEKEIPGGLARKIELCANSEMDIPFGALAPFSQQAGIKTLLSTLAGLGVVLKPQEFHELVGTEHPLHAKIARMAHDHNMTFKTSLPGYDPTYAVNGTLFSAKLAEQLMDLIGPRSSYAPHLHYRMGTMEKRASRPIPQLIDAVFVHDVAAMYNGYRASLLKEASALMPRYFELVPPTPGDMMKAASLAGLLLSSPTVVHWVSAHLEKVADAEVELGAAVNYVMTTPSYHKLSALGGEVCATLDQRTNFISAIRQAVTTAL